MSRPGTGSSRSHGHRYSKLPDEAQPSVTFAPPSSRPLPHHRYHLPSSLRQYSSALHPALTQRASSSGSSTMHARRSSRPLPPAPHAAMGDVPGSSRLGVGEARGARARAFTPSDDPYGFDSPIPPSNGADTPLGAPISRYATPSSRVDVVEELELDHAEAEHSRLQNTRARNSMETFVSTASEEFYGIQTALSGVHSRGSGGGAGVQRSVSRGSAFSRVLDPQAEVWEAGVQRDRYRRMSRQYNDALANKPASLSESMKRASARVGGAPQPPVKNKKTRRFWMIFAALMTVTALTAIDMSIISTSLPTIVKELPPSSIPASWITSAFLLTTTAFQPFMGGLADVIGRRNALVTAVVLFLAGSIACALAQDMLTLVAGRGLKGVGGGGIQAIAEIVLSDLTTLRERGLYVGLISLVFAVATFVAPVLGGVFSEHDWRWIFWINLPLGGIALAMIIPAMKLHTPPMPLRAKIARMDIPANLVLFGSVVALLLAITEGGIEHPWGSPRIVISLACGAAGLLLFLLLEFIPNRLSPDPVLPLRLFTNITAATCFLMTFLHGVCTYGATYILPVYFQSVKSANPLRSAIDIFPSTAPGPIAAIIAGIVMAATGKYKLQIAFWWITILVGVCLMTTWTVDTETWKWVVIQLVPGFGVGALFALTLPPIQSSLPVVELAHATATFAFCRSLGSVFGIAFTTTAFVAQVDPRLAAIPGAAEVGLRGSTALAFATELHSLPAELIRPVQEAYMGGLRFAFIVLIPFAVLGLLVSLFVKELPLPDFNESAHGIVGQDNPNLHLMQASSEKSGGSEKQGVARAPSAVVVQNGLRAPVKARTRNSKGPQEAQRSPSEHKGAFTPASSTSPTTEVGDEYEAPKHQQQRRMSTTDEYYRMQAALRNAAQPPSSTPGQQHRYVRRRSSRTSLYDNPSQAASVTSLHDPDNLNVAATSIRVEPPRRAQPASFGFGDYDFESTDTDIYDYYAGESK